MKNQEILIISNKSIFILSIMKFLQKENFNVAIASDGKKGLLRAELTKPDLIVLDIRLPDMDGYSVCRELKNNTETGHIPIIIISNITKNQEKSYVNKIAFYHNADDFLEKPIAKCVLLKRINILLDKAAKKTFLRKKRSKILIADDDPDFISSVENILGEDNFDLYIAENGIEALKISKVFRPDLIFLDVMLPGRDGYSVCHDLKNNPKTHNIPIILISAIGKEFEEPKFAFDIAKEHGANDFIEKPLSVEDIFKTVNTYIKN